ncbi:hypothetical protein SYNPS1DRAFT_28729 [Syncephalis pseudoplumigaleata]|uniref:Transmembrane protein n=1 Tax=Syncephalis pseudoplumigaleata TaxID=1712513 RepID=A0A4P9Z266_9FUNG|nr:hypothetical protein SYNPS1DRAFT_28729 [Syncephalis pseudoplumigaleata]|eukprot:RKP25540.1 hypothetical protein SYNPS1DRAFT_28729 [Syncephalis pseudoplumigaleata]
MKKPSISDAVGGREAIDPDSALASSSVNVSWMSDSDWVLTSQTPDSLLAITPPGGEGHVWVQVAAQTRAGSLQKDSEAHGADSSSSAASPVLVEAQPVIPLLSNTVTNETASVTAPASEASATTAPLARTLEAQIEADLVARQDHQRPSSTCATAIDAESGTRSHMPGAVSDTVLSSPQKLRQKSSHAPSTGMSELSPSIHLSPTLQPLSSVCTPPALGTLTATLRSALALHRSHVSSFPQSVWRPVQAQVDSIAFRVDARSMWTTPPPTEVDVQLVSGTAEMEALMASSPEIPASTQHQQREQKDKPSMAARSDEEPPMSMNDAEPCAEHTMAAQIPASTASTEAATAGASDAEPDRRPSSSAMAHKRNSQHRRHASMVANQPSVNDKSTRRSAHSGSTSTTTRRKSFHIRNWRNSELTLNIFSITVVSLVLFGAGFGAGIPAILTLFVHSINMISIFG